MILGILPQLFLILFTIIYCYQKWNRVIAVYFVFGYLSFVYLLPTINLTDSLRTLVVVTVLLIWDKRFKKTLTKKNIIFLTLGLILLSFGLTYIKGDWKPIYQLPVDHLVLQLLISFPFVISVFPVLFEIFKGRMDKEHQIFMILSVVSVILFILTPLEKSIWLISAWVYAVFGAKMIFEYRQNRYRLEPYFKSMIYLPWIIALMGAGMTWYFKSLNLFNYLGVCLILYLPLIYVYSKWKNKKHVLHLWLVLGVVLAVIKLNIVQALLHL
jgi:hypothetical protein